MRLNSTEEGSKYLPPNATLHETNEIPKRVRVFYSVDGKRTSRSGRLVEGEDFKPAILYVLRWAWAEHRRITGSQCPHVWLNLEDQEEEEEDEVAPDKEPAPKRKVKKGPPKKRKGKSARDKRRRRARSPTSSSSSSSSSSS